MDKYDKYDIIVISMI